MTLVGREEGALEGDGGEERLKAAVVREAVGGRVGGQVA